MRAVEVLCELKAIAFSRLTDFVSWDEEGGVTFVPSEDLTEAQQAAIVQIGFATGKGGKQRITRISVSDKVRALDLLGRHLRLWDQSGAQKTNLIDESLLSAMSGTYHGWLAERRPQQLAPCGEPAALLPEVINAEQPSSPVIETGAVLLSEVVSDGSRTVREAANPPSCPPTRTTPKGKTLASRGALARAAALVKHHAVKQRER